MLDAWTCVHFAVFAAGGILLARHTTLSLLLAALCLTVAWEGFELLTGVLGSGGESLANRWLADPLANITGALTGIWLGRRR